MAQHRALVPQPVEVQVLEWEQEQEQMLKYEARERLGKERGIEREGGTCSVQGG